MVRSRLGIYAVSFAALVAALLLRYLLHPWLGTLQPYSSLYAAIALAVCLGGYRPAGVIALLGYYPAGWLFLERDPFTTGPMQHLLGLALYLGTCSIVIAFGEAARRQRQRADRARDEAQRRGGELKESEDRFRALADSAPVPIWMEDAQGRSVLVNTPYLEYTGLRREDVEHLGWQDIVHPEDRDRYVAAYRDALGGGRDFRQEARLRRHDGTWRWFEISGRARFDDRRFVGHVGICIDVDDRMKAQATAAASEARLASELEAMSRLHALSSRLLAADDLNSALDDVLENAIASCGADCGNIQLLNERTGSLEIAAQRGLEPEFLDHFRAVSAGDGSACARALGTGAPYFVEDVQTDPEFAPHRVVAAAAGVRAVQSTPLRTYDGTVVGMISTHFRRPHRPAERDGRLLDLYARLTADLVERLRYEEMLEEGDRCKDEFLATLAHELRNPLAPIRNATQVFKAKGVSDPDLVWSRQVIERQLGQMARLLDDLLDVSRITRNKFELRKATVALAPVIESAIETSRPLIEEGRHELHVALPAEPAWLEADPVRLGQVFCNLLNNAARYTPEGGRIDLACERQGESIVVSVRDTGIGIAPDMLQRVFDMFSQGDATRDRSRHGLGVGLSLAKGLVEMHGGTIGAKSAGPRQGSEFRVRLPLVPEARLAPGKAAPEPGSRNGRAKRRRLLIVDDLKDNADSLAKVLQILGHEVHVAYDGEEGVVEAERFRPDVILLDIGMPRLNGYDACRRIRSAPWGRGMTLVAVTGWGQESDRLRSEEAGFQGHMVKPVDPADLIHVLETLPR